MISAVQAKRPKTEPAKPVAEVATENAATENPQPEAEGEEEEVCDADEIVEVEIDPKDVS